jgi:hypothetical protein
MKILYIPIVASLLLIFSGCKSNQTSQPVFEQLKTNEQATGSELEIRFLPGKFHNHPTFAIWVEDMEGNYIETLFVTKYLATGFYGYGALSQGKWDNKPGFAERPSTLPYWLHKRNNGTQLLPSKENPVPDAITGATPKAAFVLSTKSTKPLPPKFRLMLEINQPWDWNEFWHNELNPHNPHYNSSCQPALIYAVLVDAQKPGEYYLNPIGRSHFAGDDGEMYTDISTITTAKNIIHKAFISIK